jgi:trans-2-enoyl-CoA reductase
MCDWLQIGEGVSSVKPGQRVVPLVWEKMRFGNGSWQEFVSVEEHMVVPVPDSIPDEVAAQFVINPWTAIGMLEDLNVPKGEYFLQTAAGSVIGRYI